jgi:hypothetical protein
VVAYRGSAGSNDIHVDAEPLAIHPARVADAAAVVDRKPDRYRMHNLAVAGLTKLVALFEHALQLAVADLAAGDADLGFDNARGAKTAR